MEKYRKHVLLIIILLLILFLTGCMKLHYNVTVNNDMTTNEELILGIDESIVFMSMVYDEEELLDELKNVFIDEGYEVDEYYEIGIIGVKANRTSLSVDDSLNLEGVFNLTGDKNFEVEGGLFSRTYHVKTNFDMTDLTKAEQAMFAIRESDMKFTLTTPFEPIEHNADKVSEDGKTLKWIFYPGQKNNVQVSFRESTIGFALIIPILIIVAVPFIIIGFRNKKQNQLKQ